MSISKRTGLGLIVGLLALAFAALPAIANAAPELTEPTGTTVPVGATITGTSTNAVTKLDAPPKQQNLTCKKVVVHGIVKANSGTVVEIVDDSADTAEGCEIEGAAITVKPTLTSINLTSAAKTAAFDFTAGTLSETSNATVTYVSGASTIHVAGPVTGGRTGSFSGDFTLTNSKGGLIKVD
jgi:hypothetical protein